MFSGQSDQPDDARVTIERLVSGGEGLGRLPDGRVVFVAGALPGEVVDVHIVQRKRDFARAKVRALVEPSPERHGPPCPAVALGCGGCDWQQARFAAHLDWKVGLVREALRRTAKMPDVEVHRGASVPEWGYRTSMRFAIGDGGRLGLRMPRSREVVVLDDCPIAHPQLASLMRELEVPGAEEVSIRVGVASGESSVWWTPEYAWAKGLPRSAARGPRARVHETVAGVSLQVSALSFFQSGPAAAELLVHTVREVAGEALTTARVVIDAYGGVGLFAAAAVPADTHVMLVEGSASAVRDAVVNLADRSAEVMCSPLEQWQPIAADVVIADPARTGLGGEAVTRLAACGAGTLILVSCDPVAMARDSASLVRAGYRLDHAVALDLFPQTHHVEVVSRFVREAAT